MHLPMLRSSSEDGGGDGGGGDRHRERPGGLRPTLVACGFHKQKGVNRIAIALREMDDSHLDSGRQEAVSPGRH